MGEPVDSFRRLVVSSAVEQYASAARLIELFRSSDLPVEIVADDYAAIHHGTATRGGTLLALHTPEVGWLSKADHGVLANRASEWYLNPIMGCVYGCSYCYLLATPHGRRPLRFHLAVDQLVDAIDQCVERDGPNLLFSTGELADSLADARLFPIGATLAAAFGDGRRGQLELRSKSDNIEELLAVAHGGHTTVAFSISPQEHIDAFEPGTASLAQRVEAAHRCQEAGYPVALKFEPLILTEGWQDQYAAALMLVSRSVAMANLDHVSVGCLRWSEQLGQQQAFSRRYRDSMAAGTLIEYRPGVFNGTLNRADRLAAYEWMRLLLRENGLTGRIWWSLEEPDMVDELNRGDRHVLSS